MKKAKWLWILPTMIALVCAFLLPRLLLYFEEKNAQEAVETYDASNNVLNYGSLTIVQKLSLWVNAGYSIIPDTSAGLPEDELIKEEFYEEMEKLFFIYRAIDEAHYWAMMGSFEGGLTIAPFLAVDQVGNIAFRYYDIYSTDGLSYAFFDPEEEKIMHMTYMGDVEPLISSILEKEVNKAQNTDMPTALEEQLSAWADYFGVKAEHISAMDFEKEDNITDASEYYLARCELYDESGNCITFALVYRSFFSLEYGAFSISNSSEAGEFTGDAIPSVIP